jgi:hypothetical protein
MKVRPLTSTETPHLLRPATICFAASVRPFVSTDSLKLLRPATYFLFCCVGSDFFRQHQQDVVSDNLSFMKGSEWNV